MTLFDRVRSLLDDRGVSFAVIGAAALASAGVARSTYDIDLLAVDRSVLQNAFWASLRNQGVEVEVRRGDAEDPLAGVVRIEAPDQRPVDVIVGRHAWQRRAVDRAETTGGGPPVVTATDLILLKLYAGGSQDLWDIDALLHVPGAEGLPSRVEAELAALPPVMRDRWARVRSGTSRG